jgi:hypothetical protein
VKVFSVAACPIPHGQEAALSPVVGGPPRLELERAERVRDVLERVDEAVRKVVGGVDAPLVAGVRVLDKLDAVGDLVEPVAALGEEWVKRVSVWRERVCVCVCERERWLRWLPSLSLPPIFPSPPLLRSPDQTHML